MSVPALEFVVPGDLQSATGGYVYDRSIIAGLKTRGWRVRAHALDTSFPSPTPSALAHAHDVLAQLPEQACVLVDGLALGAMPEIVETHVRRLDIVALIHMPLACEFSLAPEVAARRGEQERRALRAVRHIIVTGTSTERALAAYGIDPQRLSIVEPGVDLPALADRNDRIPNQGVNLLCVATVHEGKGHELLLEALAPLSHLAWRLQCVGSLSRSPELVDRLVARMRCLGLQGRVAFLGELPHEMLRESYLAADLFVMPTLRESYGMAVAEALAHGLPVISTRTGAIPELVGDAAGLIVEPADCDALRASLERVLANNALRAALRAGALAARARLTRWPQACERMAQILGRVCRPAGQSGIELSDTSVAF